MTERVLTPWKLRYRAWMPDAQPLREALTTLGNGHFATRGAAEDACTGGPHYPGTYLAGGYDRSESEVAGKIVQNEDLVNWPNWLPLSFRCEGDDWFAVDRVQILEYELALDVRRAVLVRRVRFRDRADREFALQSRRIVHMEDPHVAAIEWELTPLNWSGPIEVRSAIDGRVTNSGVSRYRELESNHLETLHCGGTGEDAIVLVARSRQSRTVMAQAVRTRAVFDDSPAPLERRTETSGDWIAQHLTLSCELKKPIRIEKVLSLYTSRDFAISEPHIEACKHVHRAAGFAELLVRHELAWKKLWHRADLELSAEEDAYAQLVLRLHLFHVLQTASINAIGRDVGIPARGWHGEAYRGHVFWDELFTFPFLNLRLPELTRSLLLYRYRRLGEARHAARRLGYEFDSALIPRHVEYYLARTSHGSTLSRIVHAWVLARTDRKRSWHLFRDALASDIDDIQGGTTPEGIHMGAMGGTVDLMQRCYTGIDMRREVLWLNPRLPDGLDSLKLAVRYRGHWLGLYITHETMTVAFEKGWSEPARIGFRGEVYEMDQGQDLTFNLTEDTITVEEAAA